MRPAGEQWPDRTRRLNASVALDGTKLVGSRPFRLYWLCLNIAYVCEFFMQVTHARTHAHTHTQV